MKTKHELLKEYGANRYLLFAIISLALGSAVFGSVALYNAIKLRDMLLLDYEDKIEMQAKIKQKRTICRVTLNIAIFIAAVRLFFMIIFFISFALTVNGYMNAYLSMK